MLTLTKVFVLLWAFAILWKKLVFISPSFNQISLDFYLQHVSFIRTHLRNSALAASIAVTSLIDKVPILSLESPKPTCDCGYTSWSTRYESLLDGKTVGKERSFLDHYLKMVSSHGMCMCVCVRALFFVCSNVDVELKREKPFWSLGF